MLTLLDLVLVRRAEAQHRRWWKLSEPRAQASGSACHPSLARRAL